MGQSDAELAADHVSVDHDEVRRGFAAYREAAARFRRSAKRQLALTAYHEAGHAVAADSLRLPFAGVWVRPLSDTDDLAEVPGDDGLDEALSEFTYGMVVTPAIHPPAIYRLSKKVLIFTLAGPMAEFRFAGSKGRPRIKGKDSTDVLKDASIHICGNVANAEDWPKVQRCIERAKIRALELVDRRWPEIQAVARALIEKREFRFLTRRAVGKIIRAVQAQG
jgi:hypothetical protein